MPVKKISFTSDASMEGIHLVQIVLSLLSPHLTSAFCQGFEPLSAVLFVPAATDFAVQQGGKPQI